jgi:hypothetical protein
MQAQGRSTLARLIAPLALVAAAVACAALVFGSGVVGGDDSETGGAGDLPAVTDSGPAEAEPRQRGPRNYTIKANDTLSGIAAQHGTTVERLQTLNPELDPTGLVAGQRIKLRE